MSQPSLNLRGAVTILVDNDHFTRSLVANMMRGFGMDSPITFDTGAAAKDYLKRHHADLCIVEAVLPDMNSAALTRWIRRQEKNPFRFIPIIVLTGYTQAKNVEAARDTGANVVVKKPVSPQTLFDHINWVARTARPFIEAGGYMGPDRRFKNALPPGAAERRAPEPVDEDEDCDIGKVAANMKAFNA
jgi:two-component system, chemotaxis family, chemotaxis protein CheY